MQDAAADQPGGMLALLGDAARRAAATAGDAVVANDNGPTQIVVAGPPEALAATQEAAKADGLRTIELAVRGAFHTPAMEPAVEPFRAALGEIAIEPPDAPVFSSVYAHALRRNVRPDSRSARGRARAPGALARDARGAARDRRAPVRGFRARARRSPAWSAARSTTPRRTCSASRRRARA